MRHEQDYNDRDYRNRENYSHDRNRRYPRDQQNTANRWGEPDPRMGPHEEDWHMHNEDRYRQENQYRNDWKPFEQRENRHFQNEDRSYGNYRNERPHWDSDEQYRNQNQQANDRWSQNEQFSNQQHHHPRHASERFYREQRRINW
ncbi:hypothetical protein [Pontibacter pudoricolor]|uniref:hypothetical protein n=1 Tax=Pontibacter pudoricolor TaxID=2694930 RepID=UPI001391F8A5|nr:hypothetical protein [Pontibacter pudoricolor]